MCPLGSSNIGQLFDCATDIISGSIIPLIFTIAAVFFVWGAVKFFIINSDEEAKRTQGKQFMIWSIIALAVISSIWGIVRIVTVTSGTNSNFVIPGVTPQAGVSSGGGGGVRTCPVGTTGTPPRCTTILPPPGNECTVSDDCRLLDPNAYCAGGYCVNPI